jgi:opacity protein-like surface antigen
MLAAMAPAGAQAPPMAMGGAWDPYAGFYAGVNVGGGFGDSTLTSNSSGFTTKEKLDASGPVGGVQGGYNWRLYGWNPNLILGLEADFDGSGLTSHSGQTVKTIAGATVPRITVDWDTSQADDFRTRGVPWTIRRKT